LNGLIQFTLFLMGKFNLKFEQTESRTTSWNGLCSTFDGPLYYVSHYYTAGGHILLTWIMLLFKKNVVGQLYCALVPKV